MKDTDPIKIKNLETTKAEYRSVFFNDSAHLISSRHPSKYKSETPFFFCEVLVVLGRTLARADHSVAVLIQPEKHGPNSA
jgi:hypothetical protein